MKKWNNAIIYQQAHESVKLQAGGVFRGNFTVDHSVGAHPTSLWVVFEPNTAADLEVKAYSPSGTPYTDQNTVYKVDKASATAQLIIPKTAQVVS